MKITLHIPKNTKNTKRFLKNELAQARSIKTKQTQKSVIQGLSSIIRNIDSLDLRNNGYSFFVDGELQIENYEGNRKIYHCGNHFLKIKPRKDFPYLLVVFDLHEASIGTYGETINVIWHDTSMVPNKHNMGGQSQNRFQRGRDIAIIHWMKKIAEKIELIRDDRAVIIGTCGINSSLLEKYLSEQTKEHILETKNIDYTSENGLWNLVGLSRFDTTYGA